MQENIRLVMWTIVSLAGLWFITMTVNRNLFMHTDREFAGTVPYIRTDIGSRCGVNIQSTEFVEYKLNTKGQIVYLCPQGFWPLQKQVVAVILSPELRLLVGHSDRLGLLYPANATSLINPASTTPAAAPTSSPVLDNSAINPTLDSQMAAPHLAAPSAEQPKPKPQTTAPAQNANPFIGAPAPIAPAPTATH
jgi:hypothetical protein